MVFPGGLWLAPGQPHLNQAHGLLLPADAVAGGLAQPLEQQHALGQLQVTHMAPGAAMQGLIPTSAAGLAMAVPTVPAQGDTPLAVMVPLAANTAAAGLMVPGAAEAAAMEGEQDDDGDFLCLTDGSAPESLYQVTKARAEAAVPLEVQALATGEAAKR